MNDKNPLVSVIITSYNRADLIGSAIDSALAQDYENMEIIISDNCSTDNTAEVLAEHLSNPKIKFYRNERNIGMIPNFKLATEQRAKGEFVTYISSDDYWVNNSFISHAVQIINNHENVLIVFSKNQTLKQKTKELTDDPTHHLYEDEFMEGKNAFIRFAKYKGLGWGGTLMNRKELMALNVFDNSITSLDYKVNLFLLLKGNAGFIKQPTYVYRVHGNQASQLTRASDVINNYNYIFTPYNYALSNKIFSKEQLDQWKNDLLYLEAQYILLRFLATNKSEYTELKNYFKNNHPVVYKKLKRSIKWNILTFLYSRAKLTVKFIKPLSKGHYNNLKKLLKATALYIY